MKTKRVKKSAVDPGADKDGHPDDLISEHWEDALERLTRLLLMQRRLGSAVARFKRGAKITPHSVQRLVKDLGARGE